jgi:hypothetical protein
MHALTLASLALKNVPVICQSCILLFLCVSECPWINSKSCSTHKLPPIQCDCLVPGAMCQMAKNSGTKSPKGALPLWNKLGSGQMWWDAFECIKFHLWHEYATKINADEAKKGNMGLLDVH